MQRCRGCQAGRADVLSSSLSAHQARAAQLRSTEPLTAKPCHLHPRHVAPPHCVGQPWRQPLQHAGVARQHLQEEVWVHGASVGVLRHGVLRRSRCCAWRRSSGATSGSGGGTG